MDPRLKEQLMAKYYPEYMKANADTSGVDDAQKKANMANIGAGVGSLFAAGMNQGNAGVAYLPGLGESKGGSRNIDRPEVDFSALSKAGMQNLDRAKADQRDSVSKAFQSDKLAIDANDMDKKAGYEATEMKQKADLSDATSTQSKSAQLGVRYTLMAKAKEAEAAGDVEAAKALRANAADVSNVTAADAVNMMNLLKGADYKDVLNNLAADKRIATQVNAETNRTVRAEKTLETKQKLQNQSYEDNIRKELNANPQYQGMRETELRLSQVDELLKSPNGVADEAILVMFQKTLDPGSVVREGEFARTSEGQSILGQLDSYRQKMASGQRLTPDMKAKVVETMKSLRNGNRAYLQQMIKPYENVILERGLNKDNIMGGPGDISGAGGAAQNAGGPAPQARKRYSADDLE